MDVNHVIEKFSATHFGPWISNYYDMFISEENFLQLVSKNYISILSEVYGGN